ncbi:MULTISPECIES: hypothetical protein [unclassified Streptomyces]|uniref:hypothetical protein n=1 Tax=unclassified Streptomyces TaxID=2593676 RepID=UPI0019061469|nr:hypothetical protein [Streptomyces sp. HSG2]
MDEIDVKVEDGVRAELREDDPGTVGGDSGPVTATWGTAFAALGIGAVVAGGAFAVMEAMG